MSRSTIILFSSDRLRTALPPRSDQPTSVPVSPQCSATCGEGTQRREVVCVGGRGERLPESACAGLPRPEEVRKCQRPSCHQHISYHVADWSLCTVSCGTGRRERRVLCMDQDKLEYPEERCASQFKPFSVESCNTQACPGPQMVPSVQDPRGHDSSLRGFIPYSPEVDRGRHHCNSTEYGHLYMYCKLLCEHAALLCQPSQCPNAPAPSTAAALMASLPPQALENLAVNVSAPGTVAALMVTLQHLAPGEERAVPKMTVAGPGMVAVGMAKLLLLAPEERAAPGRTVAGPGTAAVLMATLLHLVPEGRAVPRKTVAPPGMAAALMTTRLPLAQEERAVPMLTVSGPAQGFGYVGCPDYHPPVAPPAESHVCTMPREPGPCRDWISRFYFDYSQRACTHFWYGGCHGNSNNFLSMEACQRQCGATVAPTPPPPPPPRPADPVRRPVLRVRPSRRRLYRASQ
ncbi:hypothetical protein ACEWY4_022028 [Coilia grayii]|uniref:BPTI/Kunitz inhibitor domain-containing protein n=1 Tax=Coilia grayii TaxID=363190 RepID=A0ABD1J6N2_9TELE